MFFCLPGGLFICTLKEYNRCLVTGVLLHTIDPIIGKKINTTTYFELGKNTNELIVYGNIITLSINGIYHIVDGGDYKITWLTALGTTTPCLITNSGNAILSIPATFK